jgi:hypothetical protein
LDGKHYIFEDHCDDYCGQFDHRHCDIGGFPSHENDAAFIAAANPAAVLSLLDRLAALEAERDGLRDRVIAMTICRGWKSLADCAYCPANSYDHGCLEPWATLAEHREWRKVEK